MKLINIPSGPIATNAWLLINEDNMEAVLFDAPPQSYDQITEVAEREGCTIKSLCITHGHWDHMLDAHLFAEDGVSIYAHKDCKEFLEQPELMSTYAMPGLQWKGTSITTEVKDGEIFEISGIDLKFYFAPGHCPGSTVIYIKDIESAITGDVIFNGSVGRTDLPGGSFETLKNSIIEKVYSLPGNTILCPGHGDETSVDKEKNLNPFVRLGD